MFIPEKLSSAKDAKKREREDLLRELRVLRGQSV
jgi:hypothetical protein